MPLPWPASGFRVIPAFLALRVVQDVVGQLVDGPFQSCDDPTIQGHVPHHDVHEGIHELLLLIGIAKALSRKMAIMYRIALLKARGLKQMSPVRVAEEALQFRPFRHVDGHIDSVAPQCVNAMPTAAPAAFPRKPRNVSAPHGSGIEPPELLHALTRVDLGRVQVARRIDGDVVNDVELPGPTARPPEAREDGRRRAVDDPQLVVRAVDHEDEPLSRIA